MILKNKRTNGKLKTHYGMSDYYNFFKKEYKLDISNKKFYDVIADFNREIVNLIIEENLDYQLPYLGSSISITKIKQAAEVTAQLKIITIGIGAGKDCSGQVMVLHDAFDIPPGKKAKFVRNFMADGGSIHDAACRAVAAVKDGSYPGPEHTYSA